MIHVLREARPRARPLPREELREQLEPYLTSTIEKLLKRRYYEYKKLALDQFNKKGRGWLFTRFPMQSCG